MKKEVEILFAASLAMTVLTGCNNSSVKTTEPVSAQTEREENIFETESWGKVEKKWAEMEDAEVEEFSEVYEKSEEEMKEMELYLNELIDGGYFSEVTGEAMNYIYGENLRSVLEKRVPLPSCYTVVPSKEWDCTGIENRELIKKKQTILEEMYKKGAMNEETYSKAKKDIDSRLLLMEEADKYWDEKKEGPCEEHVRETDVLLHLYDVNAGKIKEGNNVSRDLIIASEYIVILESNN